MVCNTDRGSVFVFDESKPEASFVINKNFNRFLLCLVIGLLGCGKATGVSEADQYFGTYMTDDGLASAMQGRFLSEGVALEMTGVTVEKPEVTVEKRENAGDSEWYDYTVALQTSDGQKEYRGSLLLTEKDGQWLVDDVAKQ